MFWPTATFCMSSILQTSTLPLPSSTLASCASILLWRLAKSMSFCTADTATDEEGPREKSNLTGGFHCAKSCLNMVFSAPSTTRETDVFWGRPLSEMYCGEVGENTV